MNQWNKIRTEYINGSISYRKLAEKHGIVFQTLRDRAIKEKWFEKRKEQRNKISLKTEQLTAEKMAEKEADRLTRISNITDKLIDEIEAAVNNLHLHLAKDKKKYKQTVINPKTGEPVDVWAEEENPKTVTLERIDIAGLRQITSALKDLKDIQLSMSGDNGNESPEININITAATPDDAMRDDEDEY